MALLEAILEGLADANNGALRELCANATREFLIWSAKHVPVASRGGVAKPGAAAGENLNAGSLLRRLYERLAHPEPYRRCALSALSEDCALFRQILAHAAPCLTCKAALLKSAHITNSGFALGGLCLEHVVCSQAWRSQRTTARVAPYTKPYAPASSMQTV
jgi:hypothetical protein